ncbi:MAG: alanine racemase [Acutalibacteraceae bacterium]
MKEITKHLRTWVEIDLDALEYNFNIAKSSLKDNQKLLAVVKANAYGHGAVRVTKFLEDKADFLAVAAIDEALEIRHSGVKTPILILGPIPSSEYEILVKYNITPTVTSFTEAKLLSDASVKANKISKMHLAVDTGMSRIGFAPNSGSVNEIKKIKDLPNVEIEGIFSHFAAADTSDKSYTNMQISAFDGFVKLLENENINISIKHLYNSAGIADLNNKYDMVREGIILYGLNPSDEVEYKNIPAPKPVMSMKSRVTQVKTVPAGVYVSYGCTYKTTKETTVATVCAGYADGVPRLLSNKGSVLIHGKRADILGRVCMDQFMVDVTDIKNVVSGDVTTIFGTDGNETISVEDIAKIAETIGYEIICDINSRVVRVYTKNGEVESVFRYLPNE